MKKTKTFKCPYCKKESELIGNSQQSRVFYNYNVNTQDYDEAGEHLDYGESVFFCLECDEDISIYEIEKQGFDI